MSFLITFRSTVVKVEKKRRALRAQRVSVAPVDPNHPPPMNAEIKVEYEDMGWFVNLEGSWESIHVGFDEPDLKPGQVMVVTMRAEPLPQTETKT